MDELIKTLEAIGFSYSDCEKIRTYYTKNLNGLREYVNIMRALYDDRNEYI